MDSSQSKNKTEQSVFEESKPVTTTVNKRQKVKSGGAAVTLNSDDIMKRSTPTEYIDLSNNF